MDDDAFFAALDEKLQVRIRLSSLHFQHVCATVRLWTPWRSLCR